MAREAAKQRDSSFDEADDYGFDDDGVAGLDIEELKAMGINPLKSTKARPGTEEKVLMLSARYAAGLPLWHDSDCYDHGPHERELMGAVDDGAVALAVHGEADEE